MFTNIENNITIIIGNINVDLCTSLVSMLLISEMQKWVSFCDIAIRDIRESKELYGKASETK